VVARPSPVLSKQLAYDIVKSGAPGDADWEFVYAGALTVKRRHSDVRGLVRCFRVMIAAAQVHGCSRFIELLWRRSSRLHVFALTLSWRLRRCWLAGCWQDSPCLAAQRLADGAVDAVPAMQLSMSAPSDTHATHVPDAGVAHVSCIASQCRHPV
jgi:hypothetical protein